MTSHDAEFDPHRVINECDAELDNYRAALRSAPSDSVAQWIAETEDRRKAAELRLRRATTGRGMTSEEIRSIVERMRGVIRILDFATPEDRRRVYEAAQLTVLYDHENRRAKVRTAPAAVAGAWSSERVGGASLTQSTRAPWSAELAAA